MVRAAAPETDDPALRWLVDRVLLRDLLVQWALGMDERDETRLRSCVAADFVEDGVDHAPYGGNGASSKVDQVPARATQTHQRLRSQIPVFYSFILYRACFRSRP